MARKKNLLEDMDMVVKAAELCYLSGLNQKDVAEIMGISSQKVFRMLKRAKELGLVEIKIRKTGEIDGELSLKLKEKFGLHNAAVAEVYDSRTERVIKAVAQVAANFLKNYLGSYSYGSVGVAYGRTLWEVLDYLPFFNLSNLKVIQMMGGYGGRRWKTLAFELVRSFSKHLGGDPFYLLAPAFAKSSASQKAYLQDREIQEILEIVENVDLALVGIGGIKRETSLLIETGDFHEAEIGELVEKKAVGAICGTFFDIRGKIAQSALDSRRIAVHLERLRTNAKRIIGMAGGLEKKETILGALRGGWITDLVTDFEVAKWLVTQRN
ncbi:MAG TPA: sugar-binding domain-containing protein [Atribacteraceae bacterium]|nr:sugar-binding domain-containing protein [Atribacteraceae bacterium]